MKRREAILWVGTALLLCAALLAPTVTFAATTTTSYAFATAPDIIITEVQTSTSKSAGEEFVELYNNTNSDIDLADAANGGKDAWKLQYFSKSKLPALLASSQAANGWISPYRTIALTGTIAAGDYYVLAGESYAPGNIEPDQTYTGTLSDDGGALQLMDSTAAGTVTNVTVHDRLAWSNDTSLAQNNLLYAAAGSDKSLQRLPNSDNGYVNDDSALTVFAVAADISPKNTWSAPVIPDPIVVDPAPTTTDGSNDNQGGAVAPAVQNDGLLPPVITEVLPNPATPQSDEIDEYIELYNPNTSAFNLKGYTLETGESTLHDFTFTSDTVLEPGSYRSFYSAETRLSLSNSGGQARLLDAGGATLNETDSYTTASDGMAWALDETDGAWKWTTTITPGARNLIVVPAVATKPATVKAIVAAKKKSVPKVKGVSTTKSKAKQATKPKKPKAKIAAKTSAAVTSPVRPPAPIHAGVLAAVAALAVGYGLYEYRHDMANKLYQLRANRAARRSARK